MAVPEQQGLAALVAGQHLRVPVAIEVRRVQLRRVDRLGGQARAGEREVAGAVVERERHPVREVRAHEVEIPVAIDIDQGHRIRGPRRRQRRIQHEDAALVPQQAIGARRHRHGQDVEVAIAVDVAGGHADLQQGRRHRDEGRGHIGELQPAVVVQQPRHARIVEVVVAVPVVIEHHDAGAREPTEPEHRPRRERSAAVVDQHRVDAAEQGPGGEREIEITVPVEVRGHDLQRGHPGEGGGHHEGAGAVVVQQRAGLVAAQVEIDVAIAVTVECGPVVG